MCVGNMLAGITLSLRTRDLKISIHWVTDIQRLGENMVELFVHLPNCLN